MQQKGWLRLGPQPPTPNGKGINMKKRDILTIEDISSEVNQFFGEHEQPQQQIQDADLLRELTSSITIVSFTTEVS
jgi:hypothetical protein